MRMIIIHNKSFTLLVDFFMCWFPEIGMPPNHPFLDWGFPLWTNHFLGIPHLWKPSFLETQLYTMDYYGSSKQYLHLWIIVKDYGTVSFLCSMFLHGPWFHGARCWLPSHWASLALGPHCSCASGRDQGDIGNHPLMVSDDYWWLMTIITCLSDCH